MAEKNRSKRAKKANIHHFLDSYVNQNKISIPLMVDQERIRLVVLGGAGVGKSSILQRFLFRTFPERHKRTVEDLYTRDFKLARNPSLFQQNQGSPSGGKSTNN
ncbi:hypothetical protein J437_LFUL005939 [Ladona fulva]|uniref:Uncharacterized protein n=1 Tax=Ladona fulva TaxID=123851 RepID=A0A8K0NXT1_LADFU|nr:hypothetical protein J437_LFUL005939 [Ladona fulva]